MRARTYRKSLVSYFSGVIDKNMKVCQPWQCHSGGTRTRGEAKSRAKYRDWDSSVNLRPPSCVQHLFGEAL